LWQVPVKTELMPTTTSRSKKSASRRSSADESAKTRRAANKKKATPKKAGKPVKKWSANVTKHSNALDLESHIFEVHDPKKIAQSLKRSTEKSKRRKGTPYQSAMSMSNFYINRAGKNLEEKQKDILEKAKDELRHAFGRDENGKERK
jgi:putative cell wall-binding protein